MEHNLAWVCSQTMSSVWIYRLLQGHMTANSDAGARRWSTCLNVVQCISVSSLSSRFTARPCYILLSLTVIGNPHQSRRSLQTSQVWEMLEVSLRNEVTLIPPSAVYTPSLIASFSSGSVFFIITSNTPLSTSTLAKCQLPCQVKIVTLCMQGQTIRISCCCCRRCLNY